MILRYFVAAFLSFGVPFSFVSASVFVSQLVTASTVEAGAKKKGKFLKKYGKKTLKTLDRAGRKAQKKRGIVGKTG